MRTDWVKNCIEIRVEGRRPVCRPRRTWSERVEAGMTELAIDIEDVHNMKKWRTNVLSRTVHKTWRSSGTGASSI